MVVVVLVLAPLRQPAGNFTTAERIKNHLESDGHHTTLMDPECFKDSQALAAYIHQSRTAVVFGLHAVHTGSVLEGCPVPYVLLFGGTDLNVSSRDPKHMAIMTRIISKAAYTVGFSQDMVHKARQLWPNLPEDRVAEVPQGVETFPSNFNIEAKVRAHIAPRGDLETVYQGDLQLFTLVAGIRRVKDPLFLVETFSEWHQKCRQVAFLVIIGPMMEEEFGKDFKKKVEGQAGVVYLGSLSRPDTHAAIMSSVALVNSSLSEGNSIAILEAMSLGIPVIVRDIPGNRALVTDAYTGLIFSTPEDFILKAERLLLDDTLRLDLIVNGRHLVSEHHNSRDERSAYSRLLHNTLQTKC